MCCSCIAIVFIYIPSSNYRFTGFEFFSAKVGKSLLLILFTPPKLDLAKATYNNVLVSFKKRRPEFYITTIL